jgi:hypothetical protein
MDRFLLSLPELLTLGRNTVAQRIVQEVEVDAHANNSTMGTWLVDRSTKNTPILDSTNKKNYTTSK